MIYKVENFKSLENSGDICIAPLTILIGSNGTGKSSVLQPLLLLTQTMIDSNDEVGFLTNGDYVKLGNYYDFINGHDTKKRLKIYLDFMHNQHCQKCNDEKSISKKCQKEEHPHIGKRPPMKCEMTFKCDNDCQPELERISIYDCLGRELLSRKKNGSEVFDLNFYTKISNKDKELYNVIVNQKPQNFVFDERDIFNALYQLNREKYFENNVIKFDKTTDEYLSVLYHSRQNIIKNLNRIKYVGPIREAAKRIYEYNKINYTKVGKLGEAAVYILFQNEKQIKKGNTLKKWLKKFKLANDFRISPIPNHPEFFMIEFKEEGKEYYINYADSCFGLSQILPILVQSIYSQEDDIIIIEQPELHLNPALEAILADFFAEMINNGKRFIIETHSEYLLLRLRTYIKKGKIDSEKTALYFTENIDGNSKIRKIIIDENGRLPNNDWPKGFFEQALSENLMFATAVKNG
jgi:predicted ATPase